MAISIRDIAVADNYQGNAGLGGSLDGVVNVDTRPLERLSQYAFYYHREERQREEQQRRAKIEELSKITAIDWQNAIPKERASALGIVEQIKEKAKFYARKNMTAEDMVDWKDELNKANKKVGNINSRFITYGTWNEMIKSAATPELKQYYEKERDNAVNSTTIDDTLPTMPTYDLKKVEVAAPPVKKFDVAVAVPDRDVIKSYEIPDMKSAWAQADEKSTGLSELFRKQGEGDKYSKQQFAAQQASGKLEPEETANILSSMIAEYKKPDGTFDVENFKKAVEKNPILGGSIKAIEDYNANMDKMTSLISSGAFKDKLGNAVQFGVDDLDIRDFRKINIEDGVTSSEILMPRIIAKALPTESKTDIKQNDNSIQRSAQELTKRGQDLDAANQAANRGVKREELNFEKLKAGWKADAKGRLTVKPTASSSADANGGIIPYWQNYIEPQINNLKGLEVTTGKEGGFLGLFQSDKKASIAKDFTGDVDIPSDKISGLGIALTDEKNDTGQAIGYTKESVTKIRYQEGKPIGVVIDDIFYDQNDINSKATRVQNKVVSTKIDSPIFGEAKIEASPYVDIKTINGVKWGRKSDGTIEKIQ